MKDCKRQKEDITFDSLVRHLNARTKLKANVKLGKVKVKNAEMTPPTEQEIAVAKKRLDEAKENIEIEDEPIEEEEPKGLMARRQ